MSERRRPRDEAPVLAAGISGRSRAAEAPAVVGAELAPDRLRVVDRTLRAAAAAMLAAALAACGSTPPVRFHSLLGPELPEADEPRQPVLAWQLAPVTVPAQADQPQILVRQGDGSLVLLEQDRWAAPPADEWAAALRASLAARFGPASGAATALRISVDLERLEAAPGRRSALVARWTMGGRPGTDATPCRLTLEEDTPPGADGAVAAQRRLARRLGDALATDVRQRASGGPARCGESAR